MDLTPASQRPYVGSTQNNSEISLALGYNGIERLLGGFGGGFHTNTASDGTASTPATPPPFGSDGPLNTGGNGVGQPPSGGPGGGIFDIGTADPLRLFTQPLASQIAWLLPLALFGMIAVAWQQRPRLQRNRQQQSLVLWGTWLLTMGIFLSVAGFFHQYYMTVMAPAIAVLFGTGLVTMWQDYRRGGWRGWLLPIALIVTAAEQVYILPSYPTWGQVLIPIIVVLSVIALGALVSTRVAPLLKVKALRVRMLLPALALGVLALLITPTVWAAIPVLTSTQADTLVAGPTQESGFGGNFGGAGSDPILTTSQLATLVKNGTARYFLLDSFGGGGPGGSSQSALITWIKQHSKEVPTSQWQSSSTSSGSGGAVQLYEYTGTP